MSERRPGILAGNARKAVSGMTDRAGTLSIFTSYITSSTKSDPLAMQMRISGKAWKELTRT